MGRLKSLKARTDTKDLRRVKVPEPVAQPAHQPTAWARTTNHRRLTGRPWRRLRDAVLQRDLWLCQCDECKKRPAPLPADEVDHILNLAEGGTDEMDNLQSLNHDCHKLKTQAEAARAQGR